MNTLQMICHTISLSITFVGLLLSSFFVYKSFVWRRVIVANSLSSSSRINCSVSRTSSMNSRKSADAYCFGLSSVEFTTGLTLSAEMVIVVIMAMFVGLSVQSIILSFQGYGWSDLRSAHSRRVSFGVLITLVGWCWLTMLWVQFERLSLVFFHSDIIHSSNNLASSTRHRFYGFLLFGSVISMISSGLITRLWFVNLGSAVLGFVIYLVLSGCLLFGFVKRTLTVARSTKSIRTPSLPSKSSDMTGDISSTLPSINDVNCNRWGSQENEPLIEVAVRILICVGLSLLSSCLSIILHSLDPVSFAVLGANLASVLRATIVTADMSVNGFCLLCTLSGAQSYYRTVLGWFHDLVRSRF